MGGAFLSNAALAILRNRPRRTIAAGGSPEDSKRDRRTSSRTSLWPRQNSDAAREQLLPVRIPTDTMMQNSTVHLERDCGTDRDIDRPAAILLPNVFFVDDADEGSLLDFERSRFVGLNTVATRLLRSSLQRGLTATVARSAAHYGVPPGRIEADLHHLLAKLANDELMQTTETGVQQTTRRCTLAKLPVAGLKKLAVAGIRLRLRAMCRRVRARRRVGKAIRPLDIASTLRLVWWLLRLTGWQRTVDFVRSLVPDESATVPLSDADLLEFDRMVRHRASRSWWLPMACKERAIAAYTLLRTACDEPAKVVVAIERFPFRAHAWVEARGRIITDEAEHCALYEPVAVFN